MTDKTEEKRAKLNDLRAQLDRLGYGGDREQGQERKAPSAEDIKQSLRKRAAGRKPSVPASQPALIYRRDLPRPAPVPTRRDPPPGRRVVLEEAVEGIEVTHTAGGRFYRVALRVDELAGAKTVSRSFAGKLAAADSGLQERISAACEVGEISPADIIFMDVESTGLNNSPLFLVGTMTWEGDGFEVRQYLARNYSEERPVIRTFLDACADKKLLVTFNGKSFDYPFIRTRAAATGVSFGLAIEHFDLLHHSRRAWKHCLPDCKLQTLERCVCRRVRHGDIPGSEIPDAYHAYVRTDNAFQIVPILKHNMLDLVTLADLMAHLPGP